jgi:ubiquitin-protein ligase
VFFVDVIFTTEYPAKPPKLKMMTKIYHPNIDKNGLICLEQLKEKWTPAMGIADSKSFKIKFNSLFI